MKKEHQYSFTYEQFVNYRHETKNAQIKDASERTSDAEWFGTKNIAEADEIALCKKQWTQGIKMLNDIREKNPELFTPIIEGMREEFAYDVSGCEVAIGRYLDGEPECMLEYVQQESDKHGKVVDVYYQFNNSCGVASSDFINYGIAVLCLVDSLESRGFSCNLYAVSLIKDSDVDSSVTIEIKKAGDTLNIESIIYAFHTSFFRRHWFAFHERQEFCGWGYGVSQSPNVYTNEQCMIHYNENPLKSFFIPSVNMLGTKKSCEQYFKNILEKVDTQMQSIEDGQLILPSDKFVWK
jgi:hypothetical protein